MQIVIVGASLAGLSAARALFDAGVTDFTVLDAKTSVGLPLKCGEAVDSATLERLYGSEIFQQPFVLQRTMSHTVRYRNIERQFEFDYTELDRPAFERWLAEPVRSKIQTDTRVNRITRTPDGFLLTTSQYTSISCRALVLCTGANFSLHRSLGLKVKKPALGFASGGVYSAESDPSLGRGFLWKVEDALCGYVWAFQKSPRLWNMGAAGVEPRKLKECLDDFLVGRTPVKEKSLGGHYPVGGPLKRTSGRNFLVCGDAAGMVFAGTGEGIRYALQSGAIAGEVLATAATAEDYSARRMKTYERRWKRAFGRQLRGGVLFLRLLGLLIRADRLETVVRRIPAELLGSLLLRGKLPWRFLPRFLALRARDHFTPFKQANKSAATSI